MLRLLIRPSTIRSAIHLTLFSETDEAVRLRTRKKQGSQQDGDDSLDSWEGAPFEPEMLLKVLPHLWASEQCMVDILTSNESTYTPESTWNLTDVISKFYTSGAMPDRIVLTSSMTAGPADADDAELITTSITELSSHVGAEEEEEEESEGTYDDDDGIRQMVIQAHVPENHAKDKNYCSKVFQNRTLMYAFFSNESGGKLEPDTVSSILKKLMKLRNLFTTS